MDRERLSSARKDTVPSLRDKWHYYVSEEHGTMLYQAATDQRYWDRTGTLYATNLTVSTVYNNSICTIISVSVLIEYVCIITQ